MSALLLDKCKIWIVSHVEFLANTFRGSAKTHHVNHSSKTRNRSSLETESFFECQSDTTTDEPQAEESSIEQVIIENKSDEQSLMITAPNTQVSLEARNISPELEFKNNINIIKDKCCNVPYNLNKEL